MRNLKLKLIAAAIGLFPGVALSNAIDWSQAELVANRFASNVEGQPAVKWQRVTRNDVIASAGNAPLYVLNRADGHGWVIVAGDDACVPILGYSTEGSFSYDNIPENLRH